MKTKMDKDPIKVELRIRIALRILKGDFKDFQSSFLSNSFMYC